MLLFMKQTSSDHCFISYAHEHSKTEDKCVGPSASHSTRITRESPIGKSRKSINFPNPSVHETTIIR